MLTTGYQLRAARSLLGMDQSELARRTNLNVNTIRSMEAAGAETIAGRAANVQTVQRAIEAAGVEFLNHGQPGVRLRKGHDIGTSAKETAALTDKVVVAKLGPRSAKSHPKPVGPATDVVQQMDAAIDKDRKKPKGSKAGASEAYTIPLEDLNASNDE